MPFGSFIKIPGRANGVSPISRGRSLTKFKRQGATRSCERGGQPVAGALNFIGRDTLFGRYWGCIEDHPCLHFELCYYQAIDFALANGMKRVEAGAQGEHKLARGYLPVPVHALYWFSDAGFTRAVADYLRSEGSAVQDEMPFLEQVAPIRKTGAD